MLKTQHSSHHQGHDFSNSPEWDAGIWGTNPSFQRYKALELNQSKEYYSLKMKKSTTFSLNISNTFSHHWTLLHSGTSIVRTRNN